MEDFRLVIWQEDLDAQFSPWNYCHPPNFWGIFDSLSYNFFQTAFQSAGNPLTLDFISLQRTQKIKSPEIIKIASHDF